MLEITTSVHTANRGYSWSRIPVGLTEKLMDQLRALASERRGEFPDPNAVERGMVAIGPVAAIFTIRNVANWDSNGRASEYSAFAFFKAADATQIDFGKVIGSPFFTTPEKEPAASIAYDGPTAAPAPITTGGRLVCRRHLDDLPAEQAGDILAKFFTKSNQWTFRMNDDGKTVSVDCAEWKRGK